MKRKRLTLDFAANVEADMHARWRQEYFGGWVKAAMVLPKDSEARKATPIFSGVLNYFPLAIAAVARLSARGNAKHNPGQPLHWAREKSTDQPDCIARHLIDVYTQDPASGEYEDACALAWRALALLQILEEERLNKPPSRGSRCPVKKSR